MDYIVYDLEMTNRLSEIIEIGAVRLRMIRGELQAVDQFQSFVQPKMDTLNHRIMSLTGITKGDIITAPPFTAVIKDFQEWIGVREYYLCSWGPEDKWALITDATYHNIPIDWIINHNDLQFLFSMLHESEKGFRYGLTRALNKLNIKQEGSQHRALDDALNTAKIFKEIYKDITLKKNPMSYLESKLFEPEKLVYQTKDDEEGSSHSPFASLAKLFG
ncbi:3'-5' exonuclease [Fictibacillus sp. Mic-4]|uniref:3'-5' exonuclease n=1 Tax=Fictibacillus TaxID=1329200 RepID=UPI00041F3EBB|nr:3'-5' exonuclease [Fictibacillus gelatini]